MTGKCRKCSKEGESSNSLLSTIPEAGMETGRPSEAFAERRGI